MSHERNGPRVIRLWAGLAAAVALLFGGVGFASMAAANDATTTTTSTATATATTVTATSAVVATQAATDDAATASDETTPAADSDAKAKAKSDATSAPAPAKDSAETQTKKTTSPGVAVKAEAKPAPKGASTTRGGSISHHPANCTCSSGSDGELDWVASGLPEGATGVHATMVPKGGGATIDSDVKSAVDGSATVHVTGLAPVTYTATLHYTVDGVAKVEGLGDHAVSPCPKPGKLTVPAHDCWTVTVDSSMDTRRLAGVKSNSSRTGDASANEDLQWVQPGQTVVLKLYPFTSAEDVKFSVYDETGGTEVLISQFVQDGAECYTPPTETIPVPATPSVDDPCGPNNAKWKVPADTKSVEWTLRKDGHLIAKAKGGFKFKDGTTSHDYGVAKDSGDKCPVEPVKDASAGVTTTPASCTAGGSASVKDVVYASLVGKLDQTAGTHEASFKSDAGHVFADGKATKTVKYTVAAKLSGKSCNPPPVVDKCPNTMAGVQTDVKDCTKTVVVKHHKVTNCAKTTTWDTTQVYVDGKAVGKAKDTTKVTKANAKNTCPKPSTSTTTKPGKALGPVVNTDGPDPSGGIDGDLLAFSLLVGGVVVICLRRKALAGRH